MNWLDGLLISILALSTLLSARKGFSREIIGLTAAFAGLFLAVEYYEPVGRRLRTYMSTDAIAWFCGFLIVFFGVLIVGAILGAIVSRFLRTIGLSFFDRLLGAVFGLLRGTLIGIGLVLTMVAFISSEAVVHSRVAPYLIEISHLVARVAPQQLKDGFQRGYERVKSSWGEQKAST